MKQVIKRVFKANPELGQKLKALIEDIRTAGSHWEQLYQREMASMISGRNDKNDTYRESV